MKKFSLFLLSCVAGILIGWFSYPSMEGTMLAHADKKDEYANMEEQSVEIEDILTDLSDGHYANVSFRLVGNTKDTKEEIELREFQIRSYVIKELSSMSKEELKSGAVELENNLKEHLNGLLEKGEILDVYLTQKIVQ